MIIVFNIVLCSKTYIFITPKYCNILFLKQNTGLFVVEERKLIANKLEKTKILIIIIPNLCSFKYLNIYCKINL